MNGLLKGKAVVLSVACVLSFGGVWMGAQLPRAEAAGLDISDIGSILQAGVGYSQAKSQIRKTYDYLDTTPEGQQKILEMLEASSGVDDDPVLMRRLEKIMANMTVAIGEVDKSIYDLPYVYFVNPDNSFNAACSMGHVMNVNRGAFDLVANDDELAVVLGHEMGHGQSHHVVKANMNRFDKAILAEISSGALGGTALTNAVAGTLYSSSVIHGSKGQEKEADALSWEYMLHSKYNIGATAAIWQRVLENGGNNAQKGIDLWFNPSDHPNHMARRDRYEKNLEEYSGKHVSVKDGVVSVNGKKFVIPAPAGGMSTNERAYFVEGNLATAYHKGYNKEKAYANGNTVMLGNQAIMTCVNDDENVQTLVDRLNGCK